MKNYITEFVGTFFLVLTFCLASGPLAPLAIGGAMMVMVYMGGHISGGHYNPAISLAMLLRGRLAGNNIIPYWIAQIVGAIAAAALAHHVLGKPLVPPAPGATASALHAVLVEIVFTFALALVFLNVATSKGTAGDSFYGLAIGLTVFMGSVAGGPISGGAFNPAVGIGPILVSGVLANLWIYLVGPFVGGAAAAVVFNIQNPGQK